VSAFKDLDSGGTLTKIPVKKEAEVGGGGRNFAEIGTSVPRRNSGPTGFEVIFEGLGYKEELRLGCRGHNYEGPVCRRGDKRLIVAEPTGLAKDKGGREHVKFNAAGKKLEKG